MTPLPSGMVGPDATVDEWFPDSDDGPWGFSRELMRYHVKRLIEERDAAHLEARDARIAALEAALRVQVEVWQSIRDRIADARASREGSRGGQHAGVPEFFSWPPSATTTMDREARFSIDQIKIVLEGEG